MFRHSPGRNQRSKGIKVKRVLQICFLIAICFWLIYQVKHSHDKKKEFDESDAKISVRTQSSNEGPKLGRKDLHPKVEETAITNRKPDEEAEEEETVGEEEEIKHEEEQQQEDQKFDEKEDEGKGVGDDEPDEHERENSDAEVDREEEVIEEERDKEEGDEKESEENDSEDNNGQLQSESLLEDHDDDDGTARNTHEAREEHYKADDASSAVTHDTQNQIVADENENEESENSDELSKMNKSTNESQDNNTEKYSAAENTTDSKTEERDMIENNRPLNATANEAVENVASKSEDSSLSSFSTSIVQSDDHPPLLKNTTGVITGADGSSMQNGTETQSNLSHSENVAVEGTASGDGSDLQNISLDQGDKSSLGSSNHEADSKLATSVETGETDSSSEETSKPDNNTVPIMSEKSMNSSIVTEHKSGFSTMESNDATDSGKPDTHDGTGSKEGDALKTENPDEVHNDAIDSSDSSVTVRTDLETLPEMQTEVTNDEDAAAE